MSDEPSEPTTRPGLSRVERYSALHSACDSLTDLELELLIMVARVLPVLSADEQLDVKQRFDELAQR